MAPRILLLTGEREAGYFIPFLLRHNPDVTVDAAYDQAGLLEKIRGAEAQTRLIAFLTGVIVPGEIIAALGPAPYNIHPGPPERPGSHPESFAIWEEAESFGATAHEMAAQVDAGPIVAVRRFAVPQGVGRVALADLVYPVCVDLFALIGAHCARSDAPLPPIAEFWGPRKRTRKDFAALCQPDPGLSPEDLARLQRACGTDFAGARAAS